MNASRNSKLRHLTVGLCFAMASFLAAPLSAQELNAAEADAPEMTEAAEQAIDRGLKYLLTSQNTDGSWSSEDGGYAIAGTSLGLMAFMVEGHFPGFGRYGEA